MLIHVQALRSHPACAATPVVAVSADNLPAVVERAKAAGFADYVAKPFELETLLATITRLLPPR